MRQRLTTTTILLLLGLGITYGQGFKVIEVNKDSLISLDNPLKSLMEKYKNETADLSVDSGPFQNQKSYKFSVEVLDKLGFDVVEETQNKTLFRNCKNKALFEVSAYFGGGQFFVISYKKLSNETAKRIPYLKYGCD